MLAGKEQTLKVNGTELKFGRFKIEYWETICRQAQKYMGNPFDIIERNAKLSFMTPDLIDKLSMKALNIAQLLENTGSGSMQNWVYTTPNGIALLYAQLLSEYHPDLATPDKAWEVAQDIMREYGVEKVLEIVGIAKGKLPRQFHTQKKMTKKRKRKL